jgi:DNA-binding Lrp family transcriptional regulator
MQTLAQWMEDGLIKRFGLVVKHHALGYRSNAMVVWDVPDHLVDQVGELLSRADAVTLCYQRPRKLPQWRYNLFTMIHGKSRSMVMEQLADLITTHQLDGIPRDVLFSYRLFKQCGGHYSGRSRSVGLGKVDLSCRNSAVSGQDNVQVAYG